MHMLRRLKPNYCSTLRRLVETATATPTNSNNTPATRSPTIVVEPLKERELISVQGEEAGQFLQGLITNDINHLHGSGEGETGSAAMYAMFLNKAGRVLYDTIIYKAMTPNTYLIECDAQVSNELRHHLRLYRVRRKIDIESLASKSQPWIVFAQNEAVLERRKVEGGVDNPDTLVTAPDPRLRELGWRVISSVDAKWSTVALLFNTLNDVEVIQSNEANNYRLHRYRRGIGEGVVDLPPGKCFPLEANGDFLHGISFQKGCYIGQELTARTHHTGVVRKRLMPLRLDQVADEVVGKTVKTSDGLSVGVIRGLCQTNALAVIRVEQALRAERLLVEKQACHVERPAWWPQEVVSRSATV